MNKKFLILMILCISMISIGFSVTTLNSCGKSSGWVNGETYILNFTSTDISSASFKSGTTAFDSGYGCFKLDAEYDDIRFIGNGEPILFNAVSVLSNPSYRTGFIISGVTRQDNFTFENLTINVDRDSFNQYATGVALTINFLTTGYSSGTSTEDWTKFNNVTLTEFDWIIYDRKTTSGWYSRTNSTNSIFIYNYAFDYTTYISSNTQHRFYNSVLIGNELADDKRGGFFINNSVIGLNSDNLTGSYSVNSIIENSILEGTSGTDTNNDGIYDTDVVPTGKNFGYYQNLRFYKDLFGYRFLKDNSGDSTFFINPNKNHVFIGNDILGVIQMQGSSTLNTYPANYNLNGYGRIFLANDNVYKSFDYLRNTLYDSNEFALTSTDDYRGLVQLSGSNINITDLDFYKYYSNNNAQMISTLGIVPRNNINIYGNNFYKNDTQILSNQNYFINLVGTNIKIFDNTFYANNSGGLFGYDFLGINSINAPSNKIYLNEFRTEVNTFSQVFDEEDKQDAQFYNNYIGENVSVSFYNNSLLDVNPLVSYYDDNTDKVYYFNIGNYYVDNTGCVDSDLDGICDSPYTSGNKTDLYPLVVYPYAFDNYLGLSVSDTELNEVWVINLTGVSDNQTISLTGSSDTYDLGFIHNSTFLDLTCDYIIDGVSKPEETITNTPSNINHEITLSGWSEKSYTYEVQCFNDFKFKTSGIITFDVTFGGGTTPNGTTPNGTTPDGTSDIGGAIDLFTGDYQSDGQNFIELLGLGSRATGTMLLIGFALLFVALISLILGIAWVMIGGKK